MTNMLAFFAELLFLCLLAIAISVMMTGGLILVGLILP